MVFYSTIVLFSLADNLFVVDDERVHLIWRRLPCFSSVITLILNENSRSVEMFEDSMTNDISQQDLCLIILFEWRTKLTSTPYFQWLDEQWKIIIATAFWYSSLFRTNVTPSSILQYHKAGEWLLALGILSHV